MPITLFHRIIHARKSLFYTFPRTLAYSLPTSSCSITKDDKIFLTLKLGKLFPFADLTSVYTTLDGGETKTFAVTWNQECNLLV